MEFNICRCIYFSARVNLFSALQFPEVLRDTRSFPGVRSLPSPFFFFLSIPRALHLHGRLIEEGRTPTPYLPSRGLNVTFPGLPKQLSPGGLITRNPLSLNTFMKTKQFLRRLPLPPNVFSSILVSFLISFSVIIRTFMFIFFILVCPFPTLSLFCLSTHSVVYFVLSRSPVSLLRVSSMVHFLIFSTRLFMLLCFSLS